MNKLKKVVQSRTFWTLVALVVINGVGSIRSELPQAWLSSIDILLGVLATVFHVNPSQDYTSY